MSVFFGCCAAGQVDGESDDEQESAGTGEEEDGDESDLVSSMRSAQPLARRPPPGQCGGRGLVGGGRRAHLVPGLGPDREGQGPVGVGLGLGGRRTRCVWVDRAAARTAALSAGARGGGAGGGRCPAARAGGWASRGHEDRVGTRPCYLGPARWRSPRGGAWAPVSEVGAGEEGPGSSETGKGVSELWGFGVVWTRGALKGSMVSGVSLSGSGGSRRQLRVQGRHGSL